MILEVWWGGRESEWWNLGDTSDVPFMPLGMLGQRATLFSGRVWRGDFQSFFLLLQELLRCLCLMGVQANSIQWSLLSMGTLDVPIFDDDHSLTTTTWFIQLVIPVIWYMFLEILRINSCNNYSILQHTTAHYSILLQYSIKKPSVLWKTWTLGIQLGPPGLSVVLHLGTQNLEVPRFSSAEGVSCNLFPLKSQHYPLVNVYIAMERSTIFNGKIHYKTQFSIAMLNYQRVCVFFSRMRSKGSRFTLGV